MLLQSQCLTKALALHIDASMQTHACMQHTYTHAQAMEKMLRKHLDVPDLLTRVDEVLGVISIYGKYKDEVKTWLKSLGF